MPGFRDETEYIYEKIRGCDSLSCTHSVRNLFHNQKPNQPSRSIKTDITGFPVLAIYS